MESFKKYREQLGELKNLTNEDSLSVDLLQYGISETYYAKVNKAVKLLVDFETKYLRSHRLFNSISDVIEDFDDEDMKLCVLIDVMRCYDGLNHPTSFITPEGVALLILICRFYGIGNIQSYKDLGNVNSSTISIIDITPTIDECSYELGKRHCLFLSALLEKQDLQVDTLYRMLIYNLCKRIAEVDGDISISEKEWLEEIARLDDDDVTNDINVSLFD